MHKSKELYSKTFQSKMEQRLSMRMSMRSTPSKERERETFEVPTELNVRPSSRVIRKANKEFPMEKEILEKRKD